jgi:uncharacterized protein (TIGR02246 family)
MSADELADRIAIRELVEAYAHAVDRADSEAFAALFVDDATLATYEPSGSERTRYTGRPEIASIPDRLREYDFTVHIVSSLDVQVAGDEAAGEAYCQAHHVRGADDHLLVIRYVDRYRRDDKWRFASREVRVLWTEARAVAR